MISILFIPGKSSCRWCHNDGHFYKRNQSYSEPEPRISLHNSLLDQPRSLKNCFQLFHGRCPTQATDLLLPLIPERVHLLFMSPNWVIPTLNLGRHLPTIPRDMTLPCISLHSDYCTISTLVPFSLLCSSPGQLLTQTTLSWPPGFLSIFFHSFFL